MFCLSFTVHSENSNHKCARAVGIIGFRQNFRTSEKCIPKLCVCFLQFPLFFNDIALRDDIASLVQFLDCNSTNRRIETVENVQILLLECLTDKSPAAKTQSKLLSWLIWLYQGKTQFTCPDRLIKTIVLYRCIAHPFSLTCSLSQNATWFGTCEVRIEVCGMVSHDYVEEHQRRRVLYSIPLQVLH